MLQLTPTVGLWIDAVLARLGMPEAKRQDCIASAAVVLGDVCIEFLQAAYGDAACLVMRARVGEVPPEGQCESLYQLVLEVQGMLCGPHTPVLGLDWPRRVLLVSVSVDITAVGYDDAAAILCAMQQMALQWRETIASPNARPDAASARPQVQHA